MQPTLNSKNINNLDGQEKVNAKVLGKLIS